MTAKAVGAVLVGVLASAGCAFTDLTLAAPERVEAPASRRGAHRSIVVVTPFTSRRTADRCGMKKNGYNMDTASVFCGTSPETVLPRMLIRELMAAGFQVITDRSQASPDTPVVRGIVDQYFIEPKMNVFNGWIEADIGLVLRVELPHDRVAVRRFYVKSEEGTFLASDIDMYLAQNSAVREVMLDSVGALANLLDRVPPEPQAPPEPPPAARDDADEADAKPTP